MVDLDDPKVYERLDPSGMRHRLRDLPEQCRRAWAQNPTPSLPSEYGQVERIVVLGMGGSAIGGDLLKDLMATQGRPQVEVCREFSIGQPLDERTLVIASSYSGNTEEVLSSFAEASKYPAKRLVITSGGKLKAIADKEGIPTFTIGLRSEPRAALGYSFVILLSCVNRLGLVSDETSQVADTTKLLEEMGQELHEEAPETRNPAKALASQLYGYLIVVYGSDIFSSVARRWKTQFNENSKAWAFYEVLPEAGHNGVEGYIHPGGITDRTQALLLYSPKLPRVLKARYRAVEELLDKAGVRYKKVEARGVSPLSRMMSLVLLGDYVSYYLGILYGLDPSPVPSIDYFKSRLEGARGTSG